MSFFDTPDRRKYFENGNNVAWGPRQGFRDAYESAYEHQMRAGSLRGLEYAMEQQDMQQRARWGEKAPSMEEIAPYVTIADFFEGKLPSEQAADIERKVKRYNASVDRAKTSGISNLRHAGEAWSEVKRLAQAAELDNQNLPSTLGGTIGGAVGATIASLDPRTDPFNFLTLPVGGPGKTAISRIAGQTLAQGAIEAVNQFTGVQRRRELLGLEHGVRQALGQVAATAVGAGALQSVGEAGVAAFKRFSAKGRRAEEAASPEKEAGWPKPLASGAERQAEYASQLAQNRKDIEAESPWGATTPGARRTQSDLDHVESEINRGVAPNSIMAPRRTETMDPIDEIASADPQTYRKYVNLTGRKKALQAQLDGDSTLDRLNVIADEEAKTPIGAKAKDAAEGAEGSLTPLEKDQGGKPRAPETELSTGRQEPLEPEHEIERRAVEPDEAKKTPVGKRWRRGTADQRGSYDKAAEEIIRQAPAERQPLLREYLAIETRRRRLEPLLTRMYTQAKGSMSPDASDFDAVRKAVREDRLPIPSAASIVRPAGERTVAPSPLTRSPEDVAAETIEIEAGLTAFEASLGKVDLRKTDQLSLPGLNAPVDLRTRIPFKEGDEITLREMLIRAQQERDFTARLEPCLTMPPA